MSPCLSGNASAILRRGACAGDRLEGNLNNHADEISLLTLLLTKKLNYSHQVKYVKGENSNLEAEKLTIKYS